MKKNTKLHIPLSSEQKETLKRKASSCGLPLSVYCLHVLLKTEVKIKEIPL